MPRKTTYKHRWGLDPTRIDPKDVEAAVRVPGEIGIKLNAEQIKRWEQIVTHLAWRLKIGAEPSQMAVDEMLKEIQAGVDLMLPALETVQNPVIKRELAFPTADGKKVLPHHLQARNISALIASIKEWKQTCRVELTHRKQTRKKGRNRDTVLDSAILTLGGFYKEVTGKKPTVYRMESSQSSAGGSRLFGGEFLELALETLMALDVPGISESARNALAERIERLKAELVA